MDLTRRNRAGMAVVIGVCFGALTARWLMHSGTSPPGGDFSYPWFAARVLLRGGDPYRVMQTASGLPWGRNFFYPLPAALVAMPFAWLEAQWAGACFVGLGMGLLAFTVTRRAWWPLLMVASASAMAIATSVQWSSLLIAAAFWTPGLGLVVAKPNIGLPLVAGQSDRRALGWTVLGGMVLIAASLILLPSWPVEWLNGLRSNPASAQYRAPMLSPWGAPVILAAVAWRDPKARLLLAMACVPQNGFFYDQMPLLLVPARRIELAAACLASVAANMLAHHALNAIGPPADVSAVWRPYMIVGMYWPALWFVLSPSFAEFQVRVWLRKYWLTLVLVALALAANAYRLLASHPALERSIAPGR